MMFLKKLRAFTILLRGGHPKINLHNDGCATSQFATISLCCAWNSPPYGRDSPPIPCASPGNRQRSDVFRRCERDRRRRSTLRGRSRTQAATSLLDVCRNIQNSRQVQLEGASLR